MGGDLMHIIHVMHGSSRMEFRLTLKVNVAVVEQNDVHLPTIVLIDNSGTNVNRVLPGQTRARCHAPISTRRHLNGQSSPHHSFAASRHGGIYTAARIQETCKINKCTVH